MICDVIIIGAGITGISTGLLLQQAGKKCLIVEANTLGFGTTGGTTAHINTILDVPYTTIQKNFGKANAKLVAQSVIEAVDFIHKNIDTYAIECEFEKANAFLFAQNAEQEKELNNIIQATNEAGVPIEYASSIPVPVPFTKAAAIPGQPKFSPLQYVYALANAFEEVGGVLMQNCRVTGLSGNETLSVETSNGIYLAKNVIYATHIPPGVNLLHLRCVPYRSYAMAVTLKDDRYPKDLSYDMYDPYHYYRTQIVNGEKYLIVGGEDHKTAHETNTDKCFLKLESHIREYFHVDEIQYRWSSQYFESVDGLPYIGHLPGAAKNVYVATGFGGNGMVYSAVAAFTLKEIILEEPVKYKDLFAPGRIKPIAGFSEFISHNTDTVKQFFGKFFLVKNWKALQGWRQVKEKLLIMKRTR